MSSVIDITHYLDDRGLPVFVGSAGRLSRFFGNIVAAASLLSVEGTIDSAVRCRRRPGHKRCEGSIHIYRRYDSVIEWTCPECDDEGFIYNWEATYWDKSRYYDSNLGVDAIALIVTREEYDALAGIETLSEESEAILHAAATVDDCIEIAAAPGAFDDLAGHIAFEANHDANERSELLLGKICERIEMLLEFNEIAQGFYE